jgi:hypothetical protein
MYWKKKFSEQIADILRFAGYVFLAFDAIVLSAFTFWFIAKFIWHFGGWLNYKLFNGPWY